MFRLELVQVRLTQPRLSTWLPCYMHCLLIWSSLARSGTPYFFKGNIFLVKDFVYYVKKKMAVVVYISL